ncbi:gluconate 2-dehydrogenase subunit 3 family protein [Sphingomonas sp. 1P08PE]|uniref:gluconate 2-dehydrogenase subunit 3 family protein n=1 Tax=Sphingomonas sp. 1P08PE TaxID=554122 RepID=UPI0039A19FB4
MTLSRRATMQWMMTAALLPLARWSPAEAAVGADGSAAAPFDTVAGWPEVPAAVPAQGYGRDPALTEPKVTWPLTLSKAQRSTVDLLGDMILPPDNVSPGAGALGVGAFIDEWISAPYPAQQADRAKVLGGLGWLDAQSRLMHGKSFAAITVPQRTVILDALGTATPAAAMTAPVAFMDTIRKLFVLGFYTLPEGKADMGYIGDQPTPGPYPGPSKEALAHLATVLAGLKLTGSSA